jgi:aminopeptidase N
LLPSAVGDLAHLSGLPQYHLELNLDPDQRSYHGQANIQYTNPLSVPLSRLPFRLFPNGGSSYGNGSLTIQSMIVDGQPVEILLSHQDTIAEVAFNPPLPPGQTIRIAIRFTGRIPIDFGGGYGIFNLTRNVTSLSGWFPLIPAHTRDGWRLDPISDYGDSAVSEIGLYDVQITAPETAVLLATGVQIERTSTGDGQARTRLVSGPVRDFFVIFSPDFKCKSQTVAGVEVNSCYLPGDQTGASRALEVAAGALQSYNRRFGAYPYAELDVVETPLRYASGVEFPGIVLIDRALYSRSDEGFLDEAVAHEVAHQWWYGLVGNDSIRHPWQDEALTTFSSAVYLEDSQGKSAYREAINGYRREADLLRLAGGDDQISLGMDHYDALDPKYYGAIVYAKGAVFFDVLRQTIGDEAFFRALRNYFNHWEYGFAQPEDLLNAFEAASGKDLSGLLQKWLYSPAPKKP